MSDLNLPNNFEDAERFKRLFVDPAVKALGDRLDSSLAPILYNMEKQSKKDQEQDERIDDLEGSQKKALVGYTVLSTGLAIVLAAGWDWVTSLFKRA